MGGRGGRPWPTCAPNAPTTLWARRDDVVAEVRDQHRNSHYLEGFDLTPSLHATSSLEEAVRAADVLVMGVPSHGMRETAKDWRPSYGRGCRW